MELSRTPLVAMAMLAASSVDGGPGRLLDDGWHGCRDRGAVAESSLPKTVRGDRNSPCPCGSGKKFKKCCRGKVVKEPTELPPNRPTQN